MPDASRSTSSHPSLRPWSTPTLIELPKLTALTLASAIGGGGGTGGGGSTVFGLLLAAGLLLGAGGCALDQESVPTPEAPRGTLQLLSCRADRDTRTLACEAPAAAPGQGILGNQGTVVGLRSDNVSYDGGTGVLSADVTVQNLTTGPIGTQDGSTLSSGVSVFFVAGPDATPAGAVTVANPTGTNGTFTGSGQTYFNYPQILNAFEISAPVTWEFQFSGGADAFTFSALVAADLLAPGAVQSWSVEPGFGTPVWRGVSGWGTDGIFLAADQGVNYIHEDGAWRSINDPSPITPNPTKISVGTDSKVVMVDGTTVRYWDRSGWETLTPPTGYAVGASIAYGTVFLAGSSLFRRTSAGWEDEGVPDAGLNLTGAWTVGGLIVVRSNDGRLWTWNEGYTELGAPGSGQTNSGNHFVFGPDTSTLWSVSDAMTNTTVRFYNGTDWSSQTLPFGPLDGAFPRSGSGTSDTSAFITSDDYPFGYVFHWNGSGWMLDTTITGSTPGGIWARNDGEAVVSWQDGKVWQRNGMGVDTPLLSTGAGRAAWMVSDGTTFVVVDGGNLRRYDDTVWTSLGQTFVNVGKLWASGPNDVWTTGGDYSIAHFDGNSLSSVSLGGMIGYGVGGSGPTDAWAVGYQGTISHYDGATWTMVVNDCALGCDLLLSVYAASPTFAVAVGDNSAIRMWNGTSWSTATSPVGVNFRSVHGTSATDVWAVGTGGVILHWDGGSWSQVSSGGATEDLNGVWASGPEEAYAVGGGGNILRWNGVSWQFQSVAGIGGSYPLYAVAVRNGRGIIAGDRVFRGRN